jgi:hypothetical protein
LFVEQAEDATSNAGTVLVCQSQLDVFFITLQNFGIPQQNLKLQIDVCMHEDMIRCLSSISVLADCEFANQKFTCELKTYITSI